MRMSVKLLCCLLVGSAALVGGCSDSKHPSLQADPLDSRGGFCDEWGKRACNQAVVDACLAQDAAECAAKQAAFCLTIVGEDYARKNADACLAKVGEAYADAKLTADEADVVMNLAAPCNKLIEGPGLAGDACQKTSECNTLEDLECVSRQGALGTCQVPQIQNGGFPCGAPEQTCDKQFYCNGQNCVLRPDLGAACSPEVQCAEDATCAGPEGTAVCTPKKAIREPCLDNSECASRICARSGDNGRCAPQIVLDAADPLCSNFAE